MEGEYPRTLYLALMNLPSRCLYCQMNIHPDSQTYKQNLQMQMCARLHTQPEKPSGGFVV